MNTDELQGRDDDQADLKWRRNAQLADVMRVGSSDAPLDPIRIMN